MYLWSTFWYNEYVPNLKKLRIACLNCGKEPYRAYYKYCSNACQIAYQRGIYLKKWKDGTVSGLQRLGIVSTSVKIYLREKFFRNKKNFFEKIFKTIFGVRIRTCVLITGIILL